MDYFERLTLADLDEIFYLYTTYLNYGAGVRPHLRTVLEAPETIGFKSTEAAGSITGVAIYTKGGALSGGHIELCEKIAVLTRGAAIYTGDALFVVESAQHRGLAHQLNKLAKAEMCARISQQNIDGYVLHELWVHPNGTVPAMRVVENVYGVTIDLGVFEGFYTDFDQYGYLCPICKAKCVCAAQLVLSKL